MKFSIVIPVYNVEEYLAACIDSIVHQDYPDVELLLIDDGSTDGSGAICDRYAAEHPDRVQAIHIANGGPHAARMQGVRRVTGDAVLFVDSDDALRPDALSHLSRLFEETACDMILYNASREEDFCGAFFDFPFTDKQAFCGGEKKELYREIIRNNNLNALWLKAFRRDLFSAVPQEYRDFTGRHGEDLLLSLPLFTAAKKIIFTNENLYFYRSRPQSIVHSYNPARHRSIRRVHEEMERYIDLWGMEDCHGAHHAREVRGWVECLKLALENVSRPDRQLIRELAEDAYFRRAWAGMDRSLLSRSDALLARWLYEGKLGRILLAGRAMRGLRTLKRLVKGNGRT